MYELPIPLAGHCVVVIQNKHVVFLGGGMNINIEGRGSVNYLIFSISQAQQNSKLMMEVQSG